MYRIQTKSLRARVTAPNRLGQYRFGKISTLRRRRHLGQGSQVVTALPGTAIGTGISATGAASSAAAAVGGGIAGTALSVAIPVAGAALGIILGGLLSAHYARQRGATNENAALTQVFPAVYQDFQTVINAYNSGQISGSDAITAINQIYSNYQQAMAQYETQPGTKNSGCSAPPPAVPGPGITPTPCNTSCTAGCCIQCNVIASWVQQATKAFQAGSGTIQFGSGGASKYGFPAWSYPPAQVTAPSTMTASTASPASSFSLGSTFFGLPLWFWLLGVGGIYLAAR